MANIFETLMTAIDEKDRASFSEIAERNPALKEYIGDPVAIRRVDAVDQWYAGNWDFNHDCTKDEYAKKLRIEALEQQLAAAPGEIGEAEMANAFERLETLLTQKMADGTVVSAAKAKELLDAGIAAKETEFNNYINLVANTATEVPYLNQQHFNSFGELFDPNEFLTKANEAKASNLRDYYKTFAADKIAAKSTADAAKAQADLDAKLAAAREEGRKAALQEQVGQQGQGPSVDGSPDLGAFQERLQKMRADIAGPKAPVAPDAELGTGVTAAAAARAADVAEMNGRAA